MSHRLSKQPLRNLLVGLALVLLAACAGPTPSPDESSEAQTASQSGDEPSASTENAASSDDAGDDERERVSRDDVRAQHPVRYTVKRGDTLWGIAEMFLKDPWVWPEIWSVNPQIENPHKIYPGDVITLTYSGDSPRLVVQRPRGQRTSDTTTKSDGSRYEKLEPQVRERPLAEAIPAIPSDAIRQFLNRPRVVTKEQLDNAPYIVGDYEGRLISAAGSDVFARGFADGRPDANRYNVYRPGEALRDPDTNEILGYEAIFAGKAAVRQLGDPVRLRLTESSREILRGDRLMSADRQVTRGAYIPRIPEQEVNARIIKLFDAISRVASDQIVALNYGAEEGAQQADVLRIMQSGGTVRDPYASDTGSESVELPPQQVGTLMVFRVFDRVSYALILEATQAIKLHDRVARP